MNDFILSVEKMQAPLLKLWQQEKDTNKIALETSAILASFSLHKIFNEETLLKDIFKNGIKSFYPAGSFSDFNCSVVENDLFRIELYFWDRLDTGLHSHPFYGSFQCLSGEVAVQDYTFKPSEVMNGSREVAMGELTLTNNQKIADGNVYTIYKGHDHIHKTIHTLPSVNLCVRSFTDPSIPNYNFLYPDFRIDKKPLTAENEKALELYSYLWGKNEHAELLKSIIEQFDLPAIINFYIRGPKLLDSFMRPEPANFFLNECKQKILANKSFAKVIESVKKNQLFIEKMNFALKK